ncbi:peptidylprolyl isomerase [Pimelobacter simplex]|nr:peptidylprolyl isomerase [Pimelobacter simplex]SFM67782.1 peptidyl-prolyl cis-trans isomerase B (cyclophilin B) [Pimelobacter simplex]
MRPMRSRLLAGVPALLLLATLSACGDDDSPSSAKDPETTDGASSPAASGSPTATETTSGGGAAGTCEYVASGDAARKVTPPPATPEYTEKVPAVLKTSVGDLKVTLDGDKAPCTVSSFASLAEQGYYDNTSCHRQGNDPGFEFLQCGDPYFDPKAAQPDDKTGTGGPGYTIPDEVDGTETYPAGTLAMANTGQPDSGGGQFFIVFGDSQFPPSYTVWGHLDAASLETLKKATASGNDGFWAQSGGGRPKTPVTFESIKVG